MNGTFCALVPVILNVLPDEANQGAMYRIMFFHIPSWWTAGLALMLSAGTSIAYLRTGKLWVPVLAHAVTNGALGIWVVATQQWAFW